MISRSSRQKHAEDAAFPRRALHRDAARVFLDNFRNNSQAESDALGLGGEKRIKDILHILRVDAGAAIDHGIDAIIVSNTTVSRPALKSRYASEQGGLSGAPLKPLALEALRRFRRASGGEMPLIGVGGIASADDAWERIRAGANLIQLYSAMVFEGPGIARRIARGLAKRLKQEGFASIGEAVGSEKP